MLLFSFFKVFSLYPISALNILKAKLQNYETSYKVTNKEAFSDITKECDYVKEKYRNHFRQIGIVKILCAIGFLIASILLFVSVKENKEHLLSKTAQELKDNPKP